MTLLLLASLAIADIAPPPGTPTPPACDESRCPEGTAETSWCTTSLGKTPDCAESAGWERACFQKSGLNSRHLMCKPVAEDAPKPTSTEEAPAEPTSGGGPCGTTPGGASLWTVVGAVLLLRRRREP